MSSSQDRRGRERRCRLRVLHICTRFPRVARELARRALDRQAVTMEDEYDVQYALRALFALQFDDVRDETWTPDYAGGAAREDFLLAAERIVVEAERSRETLSTRELGNQILIDLAR